MISGTKTLTPDEADLAVDTGNVWVRMSNGNLWEARRNGKTQRWKRRPNAFRIPLKAGMYCCTELMHYTYFTRLPDGRIEI